MIFDSYIFAIFIAVVLPTYWLLRTVTARNVLILAASLLFYGWWNPWFLSLLIGSTVLDFYVARAMEGTEDPVRRKHLLWLSLAGNLGSLAIFKYFNFFVDSLAATLAAVGIDADLPTLRVILPVGISFYTFQTLSYTIDVYRREMPAAQSLLGFACYVSYFPQLVAGPIERATNLVPQFVRKQHLTLEMWRSGLTLAVFGLVKKVAIADNMAPYVDWIYGSPSESLTPAFVFVGTLAFAVQIYADFSGYTDVARGVSRMFGYELWINFDQPYVSATPSEFWRRWHISLSTWLRDYLYVSLGGNRGSEWLTYRNLMITMVLGGLWHGAAWNYVLWGVFHGAILCAYRVVDFDKRIRAFGLPARLVSIGFFFLLTLYGWMLFRAKSVAQIGDMTAALVGDWTDWGLALTNLGVVAYFAAPIVIHHALAFGKKGEKWRPTSVWAWRAVLAAVILWGVVHGRASSTAFIYFQF